MCLSCWGDWKLRAQEGERKGEDRVREKRIGEEKSGTGQRKGKPRRQKRGEERKEEEDVRGDV